jgi:hypothetical protein
LVQEMLIALVEAALNEARLARRIRRLKNDFIVLINDKCSVFSEGIRPRCG